MVQTDFLVIGAGAAGLTAALYAARAGLKTCILDGSGSGGQVIQIDNLENYPGVFPAVNGTEFINNMQKQAESFGVKIFTTTVNSIDKKGDVFFIKTPKEEFEAYSVLLATGAEHKKLGIKGENEFFGRGVSYCAVCDGPFFKEKTVVVIGGGDSACTEAIYLSKLASHVELVHRRDKLRAQKTIVDRINADKKITIRLNTVVKEIVGGDNSVNGGNVNSVIFENVQTGNQESYKTNGVFVFVGMTPQTKLLEILEKDKAGYIITDENMSTSISGLFCAGDVRAKPLRQIVTACSDGAIAAFSAEKYIDKMKSGEKNV